MNIKVSSKKVTEVVNGDRMNYDKNLAIANRPRVSYAHNTLRAFIGINITP